MLGTLDLVAGDETRARAVLAEMQARLSQGPHAALGIHGTANPTEIRTAFLQLTKTYHPTRFARMAADIQRLSNEVFLALRGAHDAIAKPRGGRMNQSQMLPSSTPPHPIRAATGAVPTASGAQTKPIATRPGSRGGNDASGVRPIHGNDSSQITRPARMPSPSPPPQEGSEVRSPARAPTPAGGIRLGATARPAAAVGKPDDLGPVTEMLRQQQWDAARAALNAMAQRAPASTKLRALQAYQRGREAQLDRRIDEARVELDQALQLDPDLQLAKTALAELFTRRR